MNGAKNKLEEKTKPEKFSLNALFLISLFLGGWVGSLIAASHINRSQYSQCYQSIENYKK